MKRIIKLTENDLIKLVKRVLKEQVEKNKGGYDCVQYGTHTICSMKDAGGFIVRVFNNKSFDENPDRLPAEAVLQVAGKDWATTISNYKIKNTLGLREPSEPKEMTKTIFGK